MLARMVGWAIAFAIAGLPFAYAEDAAVEKPKGVIELFTSQGCASCPAADRAMGYLAAQKDVIALAYHVDYWNYRGWTDSMGSRENTARQYSYAQTFRRSGVYTPQAVLNGRDQLKGTDVVLLNNRLDRLNTAGQGLSVPVAARTKGDELVVDIGAGSGKADVLVVYFRHRKDEEIQKGHNRGLKVANWNSVTDVQTVGMWDGKPMKVVLPSKIMNRKGEDGCAILVQTTDPNGQPSAILGAAMVDTQHSS
ncbi:DUF1223 domain-containing protein [Rhizobium halophytocola]|uniref:DUF1223 domain-containing protein n=1 Tax=Rhizobium halophytocola TaxID=735519 RepID=A0ABS4E1Q7_9HYPH|nr:DUF1223 domain-containing protein [Rhizobium halophytocola]MBP1851880.1 hypothetical protein [Rhizobium halophytocola]